MTMFIDPVRTNRFVAGGLRDGSKIVPARGHASVGIFCRALPILVATGTYNTACDLREKACNIPLALLTTIRTAEASKDFFLVLPKSGEQSEPKVAFRLYHETEWGKLYGKAEDAADLSARSYPITIDRDYLSLPNSVVARFQTRKHVIILELRGLGDHIEFSLAPAKGKR